jgi:hypothetical protein
MKKRLFLAVAVLTGMLLMSASIVWSATAPVAKTGQTTCYDDASGTVISCTGTGQDGDLQIGVASPSPRFIDLGDGTVTDRLTGLMWAKDANFNNGTMTWSEAIDYANNLSLGTSCGTPRTDWRLPNIKELQSLIDYGNSEPPLPSGHPFLNVKLFEYWTSTTWPGNDEGGRGVWYVNLWTGRTNWIQHRLKDYVWPVRGGN